MSWVRGFLSPYIMPVHQQCSVASWEPLRLCCVAALLSGKRERGIWTCFDFLRKVLSLLLCGRYKMEEDIGHYRYPRYETENISLHQEFVHSGMFLLCAWSQRLVFVLSLPSDGSQAFQVTSYLLSEWKYLNSCCFSSFKLFLPMFLLLGSKAAICTGPHGWQNRRIIFGIGFIWWRHIPGSWA